MSLRAAIVVAVSTPKQAEDDRTSLRRQLEDSRAAINRHSDPSRGPAWVAAGEYVIAGKSRNHRYLADAEAAIPELRAFLAAVRSGQIDLVVTPDYDRLARTRALSVQVSEYVREYGCQVYSLSQPIEPTEPGQYDPSENDTQVIVEGISGIKSHLDNAARRRRLLRGKEEQAKLGKHGARPPFGYKLEPLVTTEHGRPKLSMQRLADVSEKATWQYIWWLAFDCDLADRRIALILNGLQPDPSQKQRAYPTRSGRPWASSTVAGVLTNPIYAGILRYNFRKQTPRGRRPSAPERVIYAESPELAFVDEAVWRAYQERRHRKNALGGRAVSSPRNPFAGLAFCGLCGHPMYIQQPSAGRWLLMCSDYKRGGTCQYNSVPLEFVTEEVNHELFAQAAEATRRGDIRDEGDVLRLKARLSRAERDLGRVPDRLAERYKDKEREVLSLQEYLHVRDSLRAEEARLQRDVAELRESVEGWQQDDEKRRQWTARFETLGEDLSNGSVERRRLVYREMVERIEVKPGRELRVELRR